jgi:hypothetical protein
MVYKRSLKAQERDNLLSKAVAGVKSGLYKSANDAAKALHLRPDTVLDSIKGRATCREARYKQQILSKNQEETLLKWIKGLAASGYAPSQRILREVAEEVRSNKCRVFQTQVR